MESKSRLKQRLARLFHASTLLRTPCNHSTTTTTSGSIFSSSAAGSASSRRSVSTDIVVDPVFLRRDSAAENPPFLTGKVGRSLSSPGSRRLDCGGACRPTRTSSARDPAESIHYKKKERRASEPRCPPAPPTSPKKNKFHYNNKKNNKKKLLSNGYGFSSSSSDEEFGFFSSDEEEAADTFFSSRSFSSDSSGFYRRPSSDSKKKKKKKTNKHDNQDKFSGRAQGFPPVLVSMIASRKKKKAKEGEETKRGFPVTKRSKDPYADFRDSMVEMIVERQIFGAEGLEQLLHSYLSLNSPHHHPVILRAFADISEVLFGH